MEYFHLDYRSVDYFVGRIQTRLRSSTSAVLRQRFANWDAETHGELALAFVAKVEMLNRIVDRLNSEMALLSDHLKSVPDAVTQCIAEHRAIGLPDRDLLWRLSVDVDAFLFEARSAYEILGKFLHAFFNLIFNRRITEEEVIEAVRQLEGEVDWVPLLRENRKLFFHGAAPWLAVERTKAEPPEFDLILLKRNVETLEADDYIHFRDCRSIQRGLAISINKVALWIANEIAATEHEEAAAEEI